MSYSRYVSLKLNAVLKQIQVLSAGDFPHPHSREALRMLHSAFVKEKTRLANWGGDESLKENIALTINEKVERLLPVIGFILRSTNVRNAFEYYSPFLGLCRRLLNEDSQVVLSTEWNFSPLTYPLNVPELPNFVLLGLPASEAENALIIPLAGHEIGHSIWTERELDNSIYNDIESAVNRYYQDNKQRFAQIFPEYEPDDVDNDLFVGEIKGQSVSFALCQCEEVFCDLVGLSLFSDGFLRAFEYLLAPGIGGSRNGEYPRLDDRIKYLVRGANELSSKLPLQMPDNYEKSFPSSESPTGNDRADFIVQASDCVTNNMVEQLIPLAWKSVEVCGGLLPSTEGRQEIARNFRKGIPGRNPPSLADIINAGWDTMMEEPIGQSDALRCLNDLMFKTIEVMEYKGELDVRSAPDC